MSMKPLIAASRNGYKKSLTLFASRRVQACFGWARNGTSLGYGAFLRYTKPGHRTITISMLLGILPMSAASLLEQQTPNTGIKRSPKSDLSAKKSSNLRQLMKQPWLWFTLLFRFVRLGLMFLPLVILYPLMRSNPAWKLVWLKMLLKCFEWAGPTFMKFGQWMSTRRDIFSPQLCAIFSALHRETPAHSFSHTTSELDRAFGKSWTRKIVFPTQQPVGSGCVGQVYKVRVLTSAVSHQTPDQDADSFGPFDITPIHSPPKPHPAPDEYMDVALKVLHPRIHSLVNRDLIILELGATLLECLFRDLRWLRIKDSILEFSSLMNKQLDLRLEASNLDAFRHNFLNYTSVQFPIPMRPFVSKTVLMETWEEGTPMGDLLDDKSTPRELQKQLAAIGVEALLKMTFVDNFVHADMHPGNLLVKKAQKCTTSDSSKLIYEDIGDMVIVGVKKRPSPLNLVIIDAGLTASLSQYDFSSFKGVFAAVVMGDGHKVADQFLQHAAADACSDRVAFRAEMAQLVQTARTNLNLQQVEVGALLSDLFSLLVKYHVKLESNFVSIMLSIMVLEGLGRTLDPNLDLLEKAKPVLLRRLVTG